MDTDEDGYGRPHNDAGRDRLRQIAERIQVGDTDEGADALAELIQEAGNRRASVREELADMALERETAEAINGFKRKYPKIADDHVLGDAARTVLRDQIVDDLKSVGLTEEQIAPARGDINRLTAVHGEARRRGLSVRKAGELLDATGNTLSEKFNIKPAQRSGAEYVRDLRRERGFKQDGTHRFDHEPASPGAGASLEDRQAYVRNLRAARGFASRRDDR